MLKLQQLTGATVPEEKEKARRGIRKSRSSGFTLVELAIVLGVAGVLFGGLWRLMSTSNAQMRDQTAANQQAQLIAAVNTYLQTSKGQKDLADLGPNENGPLKLPPVKDPAGKPSCEGNAPSPGLCSILPAGVSAGTTNPYGQIYNIRIKKDDTLKGTPPRTYSFMIMTSGGDTIPDASGGRISAMIGGDGGFIYSTDTCGDPAAQYACGSYGSWSSDLHDDDTYGFDADIVKVGHIASRTYYLPSQSANEFWLARSAVLGDTNFTYNTMTTGLYLDNQTLSLKEGKIDFGSDYGIEGPTTTLNDKGDTVIHPGEIKLVGEPFSIELTADMSNGGNPAFSLKGGCTTLASGTEPLVNYAAGCQPVQQVLGDVTVVGQLEATGLYAVTFIYNTSDRRLKENIKPIDKALDRLGKIKPVSFTLKATGQKSLGVIAQDLEKVYPELVRNEKDGFKSVAYDGLIAPLIASVQELKKENDALRVQMKDLDRRLRVLEKK
ncbi:MAG: tail fiber domain-containing protein [Alphaproteobacteria bacterium]|nr:tail fiber domain-containing protein [Alphaproteobacteria bacterium]